MYRIGLDIGSTTAKIVVLDASGLVVYSSYRRHKADVKGALENFLAELADTLKGDQFVLAITGSVGLGVAERYGIQFVQEVIAAAEYTRQLHPEISTIIDIGGEDAKIVYLQDGHVKDLRMNGNCAGGTGAFIDQMALCLGVEVTDLDSLAQQSTTIYPIASRCGVFSKTDIQNLIARNVPKQDIAASIFRAVAVQTASALSHGCEVKPTVLMCGGPLTFIPSLRKAIAEYFKLDINKDVYLEERANVIPAWGTALGAKLPTDARLEHEAPVQVFTIQSLTERLNGEPVAREESKVKKNRTFVELPPIFNDEAEYLSWKSQKAESYIPLVNLNDLKPGEKTFLGIDSGSTTTKVVLMGEDGRILYKYYNHNGGNPVAAVRHGLERLRERCEEEKIDLHISAGCSTGYGEDLIKAAYSLNYGMIETMAHYVAARKMCPEVSFILDIGGQDMKAIYVENGALTRMEINEACSSGCGSFIETFAQTLGCEIGDFVLKACQSQAPSDLGTRCTVFMNSKVKQVLREGAEVSDIAAGLAYSVVKNCLFKVLKLKNYDELGKNVVLQGGTMRNDSIVKAFENLTGQTVYCNNVPELMGAYGCALFAKQMSETDAVEARPLNDFLQEASFEQKTLTCHGCENQCRITRYIFQNGKSYFSGNKCEKVFTNGSAADYTGVNISLQKYHELFDRADKATPNKNAKLTIGIPRVLNMYEEFPFWHTFFTELGINVVLSATSTYQRYERGVHTVMSDNICFPAKLVHSHIYDLQEQNVDRIFYPRVVYEQTEDKTATSSYNCPIVIGYPEVVHSAIDTKIPIDSPVISFSNSDYLLKELEDYMKPLGFDKKAVKAAHKKALAEYEAFGMRMRDLNFKAFEEAKKAGRMAIVLAGRPYHTDPLVQHKVSEMITKLGVDVLTEDIARKMEIGERETFILKQWTFVNRILNSAQWTARQDMNVNYVETTSFGCGPDAFFVDEVRSVLNRHGKSLTLLKIDDINNVGSMKLRVRSLIDSLRLSVVEGTAGNSSRNLQTDPHPFVKPEKFDKIDKKYRTILTPFFTEYISPLLPHAFKYVGYNVEQLPMGDAESNDLGLKYSNNEVCYPATLIVGDFIKALQSGNYDLDRTAVAVTQLGQCRATNYPALIRKAIVDAGFSQVPVIGIAGTDTDDQKGFKLNYFKVAPIVLYSVFFGDWLSIFYHAIAVREKNRGEARRLRDEFLEKGKPVCEKGDYKAFIRLTREAAEAFNKVPVYEDRTYPKAGITGEIYLKFNPYSHKYVPDWLMEHGVEVIPSTVHNFFLRAFVNYDFNRQHHVKKMKAPSMAIHLAWKMINSIMKKFENEARVFRYFQPELDIMEISEYAKDIISLSAQFGEGWLLPAEVIAFMKQGCNNVVSMQPFGCIANHIVARGIEKKLKGLYPDLNMLSLDFDGGVSEANIANRLLLFISSMKDNKNS
ncbi:MAG: acyl-CoA dehydratase activase-related protein [Paludibacteraceae bacterium]|nr:acyl-CoA dehydratase activase-related protein [Paludibacteraceae bacterium]